MMSKVMLFLKEWTLPIAMCVGVTAYFVYASIPWPIEVRHWVSEGVAVIQPSLLFLMLFLTFCRIEPHELRLQRWHLWLVTVQLLLFGLTAGLLILFPDTPWRVLIESAMLCLLCPTATAAAVVTAKLNGSAASITSYTLLMNLAVALVAPLLLPLAHPNEGVSFLPAFWAIISRVFPLLICPLGAAWVVRHLLPKFHRACADAAGIAFYLWACSLSLAIAVTTKTMVHEQTNPLLQVGIAVVALLCCVAQFGFGRWLGGRYGQRTEGGQAHGQKNTIFIIWLAYTFLSPITTLAGGFYCVWQTIVNARQLYRQTHPDAKS